MVMECGFVSVVRQISEIKTASAGGDFCSRKHECSFSISLAWALWGNNVAICFNWPAPVVTLHLKLCSSRRDKENELAVAIFSSNRLGGAQRRASRVSKTENRSTVSSRSLSLSDECAHFVSTTFRCSEDNHVISRRCLMSHLLEFYRWTL